MNNHLVFPRMREVDLKVVTSLAQAFQVVVFPRMREVDLKTLSPAFAT